MRWDEGLTNDAKKTFSYLEVLAVCEYKWQAL